MPTFIDPDDFAGLARTLLDLADHPRDVDTTTEHSRLSIVVPDYLYERYQKYQSLDSQPPVVPGKKEKKP
jgi:hypothetical protein